jgi:hypothetical protein
MFTITPKQPDKAPPFGGWQARCPWHRLERMIEALHGFTHMATIPMESLASLEALASLESWVLSWISRQTYDMQYCQRLG